MAKSNDNLSELFKKAKEYRANKKDNALTLFHKAFTKQYLSIFPNGEVYNNDDEVDD